MEPKLLIILMFAGAATFICCRYFFQQRRHRISRKRLQAVVIEVIRDTGHDEFLLSINRSAETINIDLPCNQPDFSSFKAVLDNRLIAEGLAVMVLVSPLNRDLSHLGGAVAVWGDGKGGVVIAKGSA